MPSRSTPTEWNIVGSKVIALRSDTSLLGSPVSTSRVRPAMAGLAPPSLSTYALRRSAMASLTRRRTQFSESTRGNSTRNPSAPYLATRPSCARHTASC